MYRVGLVVLGLMGLVNVLFLMDAMTKLIKFLPMHHEEEGVEEHAFRTVSAGHRRSSISVETRSFQVRPAVRLSIGKKEWAKVRGAVAMGVMHEHPKSK